MSHFSFTSVWSLLSIQLFDLFFVLSSGLICSVKKKIWRAFIILCVWFSILVTFYSCFARMNECFYFEPDKWTNGAGETLVISRIFWTTLPNSLFQSHLSVSGCSICVYLMFERRCSLKIAFIFCCLFFRNDFISLKRFFYFYF